MSVCKGCAGTGISIRATPREAQMAQQTIHMTKMFPPTPIPGGTKSSQQVSFTKAKVTDGIPDSSHPEYADSRDPDSALPPGGFKPARTVKAHARVDAWEGVGGVHRGHLAMSGPLRHVIDHVEKRLAEGYVIDDGSLAPDPALCCEWCAGLGVAGSVLTVHSMADALEVGGRS